MDSYQRVVDHFHRHLDGTMQTMEAYAAGIAELSGRLVQALLSDNKIIACGEGSAALLAQHFAGTLLNRYRRERPGLPALALPADAATVTAIAASSSYNEIFAKPLRALGQPGDILLLIAHDSGSGTALQTIQAAHDRDILVVALCAAAGDDLRSLLAADDIELSLPAEDRISFFELALPVLHCLCELIDDQLFGIED